MPWGDAGLCQNECAENIALYIRSWAGSSSSSSASSSTSSSGTVADCGTTYGPRLLRVLTKHEFANSIEDITGVNLISDLGQSTYDAIPADNKLDGFANNVLTNIDSGALQSYGLVINKVVEKLAENNFASLLDCSALSDDACGAQLLDNYGMRIFRRPLNDDEFNAFLELFAAEYTGGDVKEGIALVLRTMFTSPQFLYRDETGVSIIDIETGVTDDPQYEQVEPIQTFIDSSSPETYSLNGRFGKTADFTGQDLLIVTARGVQSSQNGLWPTMQILDSGGNVIETVLVNHSYYKTYKFFINNLSGTNYFAVVNQQTGAPNEYMGGNDLTLSEIELSAAQAVVPSVPEEELDADAYVLTQFQIASFLSYTFAGTTPDDILLQAAIDSELETKEQLAAQVVRLIGTPHARNRFGEFAAEWLKTDRVLEIVKDTDVYPEFTDAVRKAMAQEVREVFNHVVLDEAEPFTALFDGNFTFANEALADFYGFGGVSGDTLQKVSNVSSRAGLVTAGAFLTVNAHERETGPILRSTRLRRRMLCHDVPAPPTGVSLSGDDFDAAREEARLEWEAYLAANGGLATSRKKYEFQTSASLCQTCHAEMINPLGFGFEDFDAVGLPQAMDYNGLTVEAGGVLYGVNAVNGSESIAFNGAKELAHAIAGLDVTRRCFIDNTFRMAMGTGASYLDRAVDISLSQEEIANYSCEIEKLDEAMTSSNNSTNELLKAIGSMDSVRYRKNVQR